MKKGLIEISNEVRELLLTENLTPREILMVLRDIESDAIIALMLEHQQTVEQIDRMAVVEQKDS